jgi:hypothetical protein
VVVAVAVESVGLPPKVEPLAELPNVKEGASSINYNQEDL